MKPAPFAYVRAETLDDVFRVLDERGDGARVLAGGQSLVATLNMRLSAPEVLVDIGRVAGLAGIEDAGDTLRIGAMTRHRGGGDLGAGRGPHAPPRERDAARRPPRDPESGNVRGVDCPSPIPPRSCPRAPSPSGRG